MTPPDWNNDIFVKRGSEFHAASLVENFQGMMWVEVGNETAKPFSQVGFHEGSSDEIVPCSAVVEQTGVNPEIELPNGEVLTLGRYNDFLRVNFRDQTHIIMANSLSTFEAAFREWYKKIDEPAAPEYLRGSRGNLSFLKDRILQALRPLREAGERYCERIDGKYRYDSEGQPELTVTHAQCRVVMQLAELIEHTVFVETPKGEIGVHHAY